MKEEELPSDLQGGPESAGSPAPPEAEVGAEQGAYRNLLVPLVVVPALIVMVLVAVFALFGAIAGEEATPAENLERMLSGGKNERQQATFNLVVQTREALEARRSGREPGWDIDASFLPKLRAAWEASRAEDPARRLVLAVLLGELGDAEAMTYLLELTELAEELDPDGQIRIQAVLSMGWVAAGVPAADRERAAEALVARLDAPDLGVRLACAAALPSVDEAVARPALERMLDAGSLELRGTAALGLAELGDDAGKAVLRDLLRRDAYELDRQGQPQKWADPRLVTSSRRQALAALVALGEQPPADELRAWSSDEDLAFREDVLALLGDAH